MPFEMEYALLMCIIVVLFKKNLKFVIEAWGAIDVILLY